MRSLQVAMTDRKSMSQTILEKLENDPISDQLRHQDIHLNAE
ncbi:hypothetical protein FHW16_002022 [Phyllobacterium myrsinacearum]|uniref:Uncharacterized protein n=1 Tax=Phyllobacterium myrsinacearum TaxID=28101 RepID=A0A839ENS0_9HYPH|nr:hypothetical protein [Phyllobacterium myrsinacearum]